MKNKEEFKKREKKRTIIWYSTLAVLICVFAALIVGAYKGAIWAYNTLNGPSVQEEVLTDPEETGVETLSEEPPKEVAKAEEKPAQKTEPPSEPAKPTPAVATPSAPKQAEPASLKKVVKAEEPNPKVEPPIKSTPPPAAPTTHAPGYRILVSKKSNTLLLIKEGEVILSSPISTGNERTPIGHYGVFKTEAHGFSRKHRSPMSHELRLVGLSKNREQEGVVIHQGDTTGLSDGCVRCPRWTALKLYQIVPVGTRVQVEERFDGELARYDRPQGEIWVKHGTWKAQRFSDLLRPLSDGIGNKGEVNPRFPVDINILALIAGRQAVDNRLIEGPLADADPEIKAYLTTLKAGQGGMMRYRNGGKTVGYLYDGGDFFLWYSAKQVEATMAEIGIRRK